MKTEFGLQPLDQILDSYSLKNDDLVRVSNEQLTHKQVQKARQGRRVTANIKGKIARALKAAVDSKDFTVENLFNYE